MRRRVDRDVCGWPGRPWDLWIWLGLARRSGLHSPHRMLAGENISSPPVVCEHQSVSAGPEFVRPPRGHKGPIHLAPPDPGWPQQYAVVAARIKQALGSVAVVVEHVGSTSVSGLAAKPFLDVLLLVPEPSDEAAYVPGLEAAGFLLHVREPDWHQHRFLRAHDPEVQIHVFAVGSEEAERMLLFRDRLRVNEDERALYEETKRRLAARSWTRVQDYADAKSEVVEEVIARARAARA